MGGVGWKFWARKGRAKQRSPRRKIFTWSVCICFLIGLVQFGLPIEDMLLDTRSKIRSQPASGDVLIVAIDDESLARIDQWPWPRSRHARLIENLHGLGAAEIFFDIDFSSRSDPAEDKIFDATLNELADKVVLGGRFMIDPKTGYRTDTLLKPSVGADARIASMMVRFDYRGVVRRIAYAVPVGDEAIRSMAPMLAGVQGRVGEQFMIDFSISPESIPIVSAVDVIEGKVPPALVRGKKAIIGTGSQQLGDLYFVPSYGQLPGVYLHAIGAETLKKGRPFEISWIFPFFAAVLLLLVALSRSRFRRALAVLLTGSAALLLLPFALEAKLIYMSIVPAIALLLGAAAALSWSAYKSALQTRGRTNVISELPNLNALREIDFAEDRSLVVARVRNYSEVTSALPASTERELVNQLSKRLMIGGQGSQLYHGDGGVFAFFSTLGEREIDDHLLALFELFRSPVSVGGENIDLTVSFGIDVDFARCVSNRVGGALKAAEEAASDGCKWKTSRSADPDETRWRLSLLSHLDAALDNGELWVAYQPKMELSSGIICGAEALIRWTHPERGEIGPMEFIPAAEQSDRIGKLTAFVLDRSVRAAAAINRRGVDFGVAVNVSARLIGQPGLPRLVDMLLQKYGLEPRNLTLEVTETAALATGASELEPLHELRRMGVHISIDDYGTGLSTLEYMKKVPATEIKIDRGFIHALLENHSDRLMVYSTIQLAHSMGRSVVAEGVEDPATMKALKLMGCDTVQGFLIGKPVKYHALLKLLQEPSRQQVA